MNDKWWSTQLALRFCLLWLGGVGSLLAFSLGTHGMYAAKYALVFMAFAIHASVALYIRKPQPVRNSLHREQRVALFAAIAIIISAIGLLCCIALGLIVPSLPAFAVLFLPLLFFAAATLTIAQSIYLRRKPFYSTRCPHCLYDLTSIEASTCPECGLAIIPPRTAATQSPAH